MLLKELISDFVKDNGFSYRTFAQKCGISTGYLSMIITGLNPSTGKPPVVSYPKLQKIANGMGLTMHKLFEIVDDMPIDVQPELSDKSHIERNPLSDRAMEIARAYDSMSNYGRSIIDKIVENENKYKVCKRLPSIKEATGYGVGHPAEMQARYNADQELKELSQEESNLPPSRIMR